MHNQLLDHDEAITEVAERTDTMTMLAILDLSFHNGRLQSVVLHFYGKWQMAPMHRYENQALSSRYKVCIFLPHSFVDKQFSI